MSTVATTRSRRAGATRPRYDSPSDDELPQRKNLPRRSARHRPSYRESSESESHATIDAVEDYDSDTTSPPSLTVHIPARPQTRSTAMSVTRKRKAANPPRRTTDYKRRKIILGRPTTREKQKPVEGRIVFPLPSSGRPPPWQSLPYQILVKILKYAAYPLYEGPSRPTASIYWLLDVSRLSKDFHDAAVAALLHTPPIYPYYRAHGLLRVLRQDQDILSTNFRTKIHRLDIEIKHLLIRKQGIELLELLEHTPLLTDLRLYHNHDSITNALWALPANSKYGRWSYPSQLFDFLDDKHISLKCFEWNGRWPNSVELISTMNKMHARSCLHQVEQLTIRNVELPEKLSLQEAARHENKFADALRALPNLKSLTFYRCSIINESTVSRLPTTLRNLSLNNCRYLISDGLQRYLLEGGQSLLKLELIADQALDLGFTATLKETTPHLQHLHMDLNYIDPTAFHDTKPLWDFPLPNGPPLWPTSLQSIHIDNLREVDLDEGEEFMLSLANAADTLRDLRHINIKILLKHATWRDRADMRKRWSHLLPAIFKNISDYHPTPTSSTMIALAKVPQKSSSTTKRQSSRLSRRGSADASSNSGNSKPTYTFKDIKDMELPTQNMCSTVLFSVSDQRPAAEQYVEGDFLDSERSGDEDWNGVDRDWD